MTDTPTQCDPTPPSARRITLKDGRYMIFFEFNEEEKPTDQDKELNTVESTGDTNV
jgi:hypothetical protein